MKNVLKNDRCPRDGFFAHLDMEMYSLALQEAVELGISPVNEPRHFQSFLENFRKDPLDQLERRYGYLTDELAGLRCR